MRAWQWIMAITIFFLHCLADHLLLQLTCEWSWWPRWLTPGEPKSGKSCARWKETERESKGPRPQRRVFHAALSGELDWSACCLGGLPHLSSTMLSILFGVQGLLVRHWHRELCTDRCCHPNCVALPPTRQELSAGAAEDLGPCWERDPNLALAAAPINVAGLIVLKVKGVVTETVNTILFVTLSV